MSAYTDTATSTGGHTKAAHATQNHRILCVPFARPKFSNSNPNAWRPFRIFAHTYIYANGEWVREYPQPHRDACRGMRWSHRRCFFFLPLNGLGGSTMSARQRRATLRYYYHSAEAETLPRRVPHMYFDMCLHSRQRGCGVLVNNRSHAQSVSPHRPRLPLPARPNGATALSCDLWPCSSGGITMRPMYRETMPISLALRDLCSVTVYIIGWDVDVGRLGLSAISM